jgi:TolB protein
MPWLRESYSSRPFFMHNLFRLGLILALVVGFARAQPKVDLGRIDVVVDNAAIAVRVTANSADLQNLAQVAFNSHGRYKVVGSGQSYDIKFTSLAPTQVRVDVTKGSAATPVVSQIVTGNSPRNALLRAADVAVEKTNGLNLRGYFASRLAFISQRTGRREVYVSDLFMGEAKQLTRDGALALSPRWSPDGSRLIYTSYFKTGAPDIYLLDVTSARKDTFASYRGTNMGARFSPRGDRVVMVCTPSGGISEIFVANAQGREAARLTRSDVVKSSPCWSPDGSQIVFAMGEPSPQLYVIGAAGGTPRRIATGFTYMAEPDWSRTDRNKIACTVRVPGNKYQIAIVDVASGTTKLVSKAPFDAIEPSWLADGRHLVYTAQDRSTTVLSILDTETGKSTPVNSNERNSLQSNVWMP